MTEFPEYVIKPNTARLVISSFLVTLFLATVFYLGIFLNVVLLGIDIPTTIGWLIISVLFLLVLMQALLAFVQASKTRYAVYKNRLQLEGAKQGYIMFNAVQDVTTKKTFFDTIFNTGTILIQPNMKLEAVLNVEQTTAYLKQMIQFARTQYMQQ